MDARKTLPYFDPSQNFRNTGHCNYPIHRTYVGDTCVLKKDFKKIGLVVQTHPDIDSHLEQPLSQYGDIRRHPDISPPDFDDYLASGIPPRGTVVLSWSIDGSSDPSEQEWTNHVAIVPETEVEAVDREICAGDVVKLNPGDAMSGVVLATQIQANLVEPLRWPSMSSAESHAPPPSRIVHNVDTLNLVSSLEIDVGEFIYYNGWLGLIIDYHEAVELRLSNNSVVRLSKVDIERNEGNEILKPLVGDFIKAKKHCIRNGEFIYGEYDPNIAPCGYVARVSVELVDVEWLAAKHDRKGSDVPATTLEKDELPNIFAYGRHRKSTNRSFGRHEMDLCAGDKVRIRDVSSLDESQKTSMHWIPRQDTLGYDTNVYTVASTFTKVKVQWQNNTISGHPSIALAPTMEFDDEDDVEVGELVTTKAQHNHVDGVRRPFKAGIVQSVRSRDRIANVRWFEGQLSFLEDDETSLIPGSWTGRLLEATEEISLYDIWIEPGLRRRIGDFVTIILPFSDLPVDVDQSHVSGTPYIDTKSLLAQPDDTREWFGELVGMGTNGLVRIHLGAADNPRDIEIPWECTHLAYSSDLDDSESGYDSDMEEETSDSTNVPTGLSNVNGTETAWFDAQGQPIEDGSVDDAGWSTDDEDIEMPDASELKSGDIDCDSHSSPSNFSYETMLESIDIAKFAVLEGGPSTDHHFGEREASRLNGPRLKRIQKEHRILASALPAGVFVRTWEATLHLLRVLILGPLGTPYTYAPFVIDMCLDDDFPNSPPQTYFHSWTDGSGPVNPNLYEDGKICLSLLGTWPGSDPSDTWSPKATILQVLVSLLGLVLVENPYYNEAGFEVRTGSAESKIPSALYAERSFLKTRKFLITGLDLRVAGFETELNTLYFDHEIGRPKMLTRAIWDAINVIRRSEVAKDGRLEAERKNSKDDDRIISAGAIMSLRRTTDTLITMLNEKSAATETAQMFQQMLKTPCSTSIPSFEEILTVSSTRPASDS